MAKPAVDQMLHDTSQGMDILSKKLCFDFVCLFSLVQAVTDFTMENVCLQIESAECVRVHCAIGMCVKKLRGAKDHRWTYWTGFPWGLSYQNVLSV